MSCQYVTYSDGVWWLPTLPYVGELGEDDPWIIVWG